MVERVLPTSRPTAKIEVMTTGRALQSSQFGQCPRVVQLALRARSRHPWPGGARVFPGPFRDLPVYLIHAQPAKEI